MLVKFVPQFDMQFDVPGAPLSGPEFSQNSGVIPQRPHISQHAFNGQGFTELSGAD